MPTRKELLSAFDAMEGERQQLLARLKPYTEEILCKKPDPDSWSVTQVVYHLKIAEEGALLYMNKKLAVGGHQKATLGAAIKQRLLNLAVSLPIKYKAPRVVQLPAEMSISFAQAVTEWDAVRAQLREQYTKVDESIIGNELFKHPMAGKLSMLQSVKFMRQHAKRHFGQINRVLNAVS